MDRGKCYLAKALETKDITNGSVSKHGLLDQYSYENISVLPSIP